MRHMGGLLNSDRHGLLALALIVPAMLVGAWLAAVLVVAGILGAGIGIATIHYRNAFEDPDFDPGTPPFDVETDFNFRDRFFGGFFGRLLNLCRLFSFRFSRSGLLCRRTAASCECGHQQNQQRHR